MQIRMSNGQQLFDSVQATWNLLEQSAGAEPSSVPACQSRLLQPELMDYNLNSNSNLLSLLYTPHLSVVKLDLKPTITFTTAYSSCVVRICLCTCMHAFCYSFSIHVKSHFCAAPVVVYPPIVFCISYLRAAAAGPGF